MIIIMHIFPYSWKTGHKFGHAAKEAITVFAKMESEVGGNDIAPKQTDRSQVEWKKKKKHKTKKLQNRMAAFPGSAVKFPRCRLKLEEDDAKQMKERMSNRQCNDLNEDDETLPTEGRFFSHEDMTERKKHLSSKYIVCSCNFLDTKGISEPALYLQVAGQPTDLNVLS